MKLELIHLTTPAGRVAIAADYIVAVAEVKPPKRGINDVEVNTQIYTSPDVEPYNIIESYDDVMEMLK